MSINPKKIRTEIAIRTKALIAAGVNPNKALNDARAEANAKYGHGWREQEIHRGGDYSTWWNECNTDGTFAYNGVTDDF